jgi:hypothetical protein
VQDHILASDLLTLPMYSQKQAANLTRLASVHMEAGIGSPMSQQQGKRLVIILEGKSQRIWFKDL